MSEEAGVDTGLRIMDGEQMNEEKGSQEKSSPLGKHSVVMMTGEGSVRGSTPEKEIGREGSGLSELGSLPFGSFQSLPSSQGSKKDKMITYVPPLAEMKVLKFEDTLSEEGHRNFNLIYETLLMERKAGNLTDLTLGMVLAVKPPTWLQVMHGRLKHLIISSKTFKEKKKAEYHSQAKAKQTNKGKGMGKHSKGIRYLGISGKGKRPSRRNTKTKITSLNTGVALKKNQSPSSTIGTP